MTEQKKLGAILLNIFILLSLPLIIKGEEINGGNTTNQYDEYDEQRIRRELELLPILSLERTRREMGRAGRMYMGFADEVFRGRIIPKVVPSTATLAIDGIGCGISTGNIIGPASTWGTSFQARWGYEVLNVGCPNDDAGWCDDKDWPAPSACVDANRDYICDCGWGGCNPGCDDINAPDCGYREKLGDMTGEFEGLFQYVAERLKEALVQRDLRILVNKSLCGKGSCVDTPWPLDHLCLTVNQDPNNNNNPKRDVGHRVSLWTPGLYTTTKLLLRCFQIPVKEQLMLFYFCGQREMFQGTLKVSLCPIEVMATQIHRVMFVLS